MPGPEAFGEAAKSGIEGQLRKLDAEYEARLIEIAQEQAAAELTALRERVKVLRDKYMALHLRACMAMRLDSFDSVIRNSLSDDDECWTDFERAAFKATNAALSAIEAAVYWKAVADGEVDRQALNGGDDGRA